MKLIVILSTFLSFNIATSYSQNNIDNKNEVLIVVDKVPVHKDCNENSNNEELKKCMLISMHKFISENFDTTIANELNIPDGIIEIKVHFDINKRGKISNISAESEYKKLQKEAKRVFKSMPKMKMPGYINEKPVTIPYVLPIKFPVYNSKFQ